MKAHFRKQYLLQILKKSPLNLVTGFFLTKAHFKKQYLLQISEEGCLKHYYGIFMLRKHTLKAVCTYKILKKGALNIVTGFLFYESTL